MWLLRTVGYQSPAAALFLSFLTRLPSSRQWLHLLCDALRAHIHLNWGEQRPECLQTVLQNEPSTQAPPHQLPGSLM